MFEHDERIEGGSSFGLKNSADGRFIEGMGSEAVNGFGGNGDELAVPKDCRGLVDSGLRGLVRSILMRQDGQDGSHVGSLLPLLSIFRGDGMILSRSFDASTWLKPHR
jgi:hypothetical protein